MSEEIQVKRYASFYRGWCQAFGEHDGEIEESVDFNWIYGEEAIGMLLSTRLQRRLIRHLIGRGNEQPCIVLSSSGLQVGEDWICLESETDIRGLERMRSLFSSGQPVHMFMTSHFCYPSGTRIVTFSTRKPLPIVYKEIPPLNIELVE
jgi:hypothetical protein